MEKILFLDNDENVKHTIIFGKQETNTSSISYNEQKIYKDDTVFDLKCKIFEECQKHDSLKEVKIDTMYLFAYIKDNIDFNYLKKNLTEENYVSMLRNYKSPDFEFEKKTYIQVLSYLENSFYKNKHIYKLIPIGQKADKDYFNSSINPLKYKPDDKINFVKDNKNIVLEYLDIYEEQIFAIDLHTIINSDNSHKNDILKHYFIYSSLEDTQFYVLKKNELSSLSIEQKNNNEKYINFYNNINNFESKMNYSHNGIHKCQVEFSSFYNLIYPIDILFKIFGTSKLIPYIKYNPGLREEKLNRFYIENKNIYLNSLIVHRLQKNMSINNSVQMYVLSNENEFILSFLNNGSIQIYFETTSYINIDKLEELFKSVLNPIITNVQTIFQQYGYYYNTFQGFNHYETKILNISLKYLFKYKKSSINVPSKLLKCLLPLIELNEEATTKEINFLYKRVGSSLIDDIIIKTFIDKYQGEIHLAFNIDNLNNYYYIDIFNAYINLLSNMFFESSQKSLDESVCKNLSSYDYEKIEKEESEQLIEENNIKIDKRELSEAESDDFSDNDVFLSRRKDSESESEQDESVEKESDKEESVEEEPVEKEDSVEEEPVEKDEPVEKESDKEESVEKESVEKEPVEKDEPVAKEESVEKDEPVEKDDSTKNTDNNIVSMGSDLINNIGSTISNVASTVGDAYDKSRTKINKDISKQQQESDNKESKSDKSSLGSSIGSSLGSSIDSSIGSSIEADNNSSKSKSGGYKMVGGAPTNQNIRKFFQERISSRDKALFDKFNQNNNFAKYCPQNLSRQPVILNEEEKKNIDENFPDSYNKSFIHYGSSEKNKNYYICPRYWCIEGNTSLNPQDVVVNDKGELTSKYCDGTIHEFTSPLQHKDKAGNYRFSYPGLLKKKGECLPCCFGKDNKDINSHIKKCMSSEEKNEVVDEQLPDRDDTIAENITTANQNDEIQDYPENDKNIDKINYIQQSNKFPLDAGKVGYLPLTLQKIFDIENKDYTLIHLGCNQIHNKSFICCMAQFFSLIVLKSKNIFLSDQGLDIKTMNNRILQATTLDNFITLHNGNLIHIFDNNQQSSLNIEDFKDTLIHKNLFENKNSNSNFLMNKILNAYENFQNYIINNDTLIDYKYLWDIFCNPHPKLFPEGVNIIIFEMSSELNDYVELLCPPNYYTTQGIDINKHYCFILKKDHYYEPIIFFKKDEDYTKIRALRNSLIVKYGLDNINNIIKYIDDLYKKNICSAHSGSSTVGYNSIYSKTLLDNLPLINLLIQKQVVNLNGKIIGFIVEIKNTELLEKIRMKSKNNVLCYLPCFPSFIRHDIDILLLESYNLQSYLHSYDNTKIILNFIFNKTKVIDLRPMKKVELKDNIIGIVSNGNMFIPSIAKQKTLIDDDMEEIPNNYIVFTGDNYMYLDEIILSNNEKDDERIQTVKKIKLENELYNIFRNLARMIVNNYNNLDVKNKILNILNTEYFTYLYKFKLINDILKDLLEKYITFTSKMANIEKKQNIFKCIDATSDCNVFLPIKNLITKKMNNIVYFEKLTDEIIRFKQYRKFMFDTQHYLNSTLNDFNINENELILPQSLTNISYLDSLNKKDTTNNYETSVVNDYISPTVYIDKKNTKTRKKKECPKKCPRKTRCNKKKGVCEPIEGQNGGTNGYDETTNEPITDLNIPPFDVPDDLSEIGDDGSDHGLEDSFEFYDSDDDLGLNNSNSSNSSNSSFFGSVLSGIGLGPQKESNN